MALPISGEPSLSFVESGAEKEQREGSMESKGVLLQMLASSGINTRCLKQQPTVRKASKVFRGLSAKGDILTVGDREAFPAAAWKAKSSTYPSCPYYDAIPPKEHDELFKKIFGARPPRSVKEGTQNFSPLLRYQRNTTNNHLVSER